MDEKYYAIGIDYGTESGRAVLVSLDNGKEIADHVTQYRHGVIDQKLPDSGLKLGHDWAIQNPEDYMDVLKESIPAILKSTNVSPDRIIGIGVDFTACTMMPIDVHAEPLCFHSEFRGNPHSWVKLWKHHAAQKEATEINEIAFKRKEAFLQRYGGKISSEWMIPKIYQTCKEAYDIYKEADQFVEAGDWVVSRLTNNLKRNSCAAGYKATWHKQEGYPSNEFLKAVDPRLEHLVETKLRGSIFPLGTKAGELTEEMAIITGLNTGTAVAVGVIDAHASVPAMSVVEPGKMVMAMGTSICHMLLDEEEKYVEGVAGVVEDGIIPGLFSYEAGQPAGGDIFEWYVEHVVPEYVKENAKDEGNSVHQWLEHRAAAYKPGETGLLALDWWNGNRSVLVDADLSGVLVGMTLQTKPEEIYRALMEATAFGTRKIIDAFRSNGIDVNELYACGGLPNKNQLLMQIYADVTNLPIKVADSTHTSAVGASMFGAVAAGSSNAGFDSVMDAAKTMGRIKDKVITPRQENVVVYEELYQAYTKIHDFFGSETNVMKYLKEIKSTYTKEK